MHIYIHVIIVFTLYFYVFFISRFWSSCVPFNCDLSVCPIGQPLRSVCVSYSCTKCQTWESLWMTLPFEGKHWVPNSCSASADGIGIGDIPLKIRGSEDPWPYSILQQVSPILVLPIYFHVWLFKGLQSTHGLDVHLNYNHFYTLLVADLQKDVVMMWMTFTLFIIHIPFMPILWQSFVVEFPWDRRCPLRARLFAGPARLGSGAFSRNKGLFFDEQDGYYWINGDKSYFRILSMGRNQWILSNSPGCIFEQSF